MKIFNLSRILNDKKSSFEELLCISLILVGHIFLLRWMMSGTHCLYRVGTYILPNMWLLIASYLYLKRYPLKRISRKFCSHLDKVMLGTIFVLIVIAVLNIKFLPYFTHHMKWIYAFFLIFIVPITEEVFFRGILLEHFWRQWEGPFLAIGLVTLIFASFHSSLLLLSILSIFLCYLAMNKGILWAILGHMIYNIIFVINEIY